MICCGYCPLSGMQTAVLQVTRAFRQVWQDAFGDTALHRAAALGQTEVLGSKCLVVVVVLCRFAAGAVSCHVPACPSYLSRKNIEFCK